VFFSFSPPLCLGDPYQDGGTLMKKGKVQMLDPDACFKPPGMVKKPVNKLGYAYEYHMDTAKDPQAIKEALKDVMPPRQIYTNPTKKGGGGVLTGGVLFGFGEERKFQEFIPDDYDAARKIRKEELKHHAELLEKSHPGSSFKSMAYGNDNFGGNTETFHYDVPTHIPRDPKPSTYVNPHTEPFRPCNPLKKGMLKGLLGEFPEHIPDPMPQPVRKAKDDGEEKHPFKVGFPVHVPKPTPSVTTLTRNMRSERPSSFARPLL